MGRTVEQDLRASVRACWVAAATMAALVAAAGCFGLEKSRVVFGWLFAAPMVGAGVAASYAGWSGRGPGDYFVAWMTAGAMCLLPAAMCLSIPRLSSDGTDEEGGGTPKASSEETAQI